jgi:hypothetical protein
MYQTVLLLFLGKAKGAILARLDGTGACEGNVLEGMSQSAAPAITNGYFSVHFNRSYLVHQLQGVAAMLSKRVLKSRMQRKRER